MMTMGSYIKELRIQKKISQQQLGSAVGVKRAAVCKWEKGDVENIKRETIIRLSKIFDVPVSRLMCIDDCNSPTDFSPATSDIPVSQDVSSIKKEEELLKYFAKLNDLGQDKAINNVADLSEISKYIIKPNNI